MTRALITGAAGFIGSHVADECLRLGMEVVATDALSGGFLDNVSADATWVEGDIRDRDFVESLWESGTYRLRLPHWPPTRRRDCRTSSASTTTGRTSRRACSCSTTRCGERSSGSSFVVDRRLRGGADADDRGDDARPGDPYGVSKYAVELDLAAAKEMFGLAFSIFRPGNVYGERQNISDPYRNVMGYFMNEVMRGEPLPVFGDGLQTRAFSHSPTLRR